jgi:hypothetical protein
MSQVTLAWAVNNMTRVLDDGFVIKVDWSCTAGAVDSQTPPQPIIIQGAFYGGQTMYENNPSEPGFIPYDQLTQEIVLGWVYAGLGDQKAVIEATLTAKVEKQLNPTTANGVPWNTNPAQA